MIFANPDDQLNNELPEFIKFERQCCLWLKFQLTFQPENGPVSLSMGHSAETKAMVNLVMEIDKIGVGR